MTNKVAKRNVPHILQAQQCQKFQGIVTKSTVSSRECWSLKVLWGNVSADFRQFQVGGEGKKKERYGIDRIDIHSSCQSRIFLSFVLFAPLLVIVLWPQYREKIAQHRLRAIAVLHFPICVLKSCPAPAALAAGAGHYFSLTAYNLTF